MQKALLLLKKIPRGKVVTYKELARACGTSPRAIGQIMAKNADPVTYPCYKVVSSKGKLCGYSAPGGIKTKQELLGKEGIKCPRGTVHKKYFYTFNLGTRRPRVSW
ncbi:MAG: MGMT family protein [Candidatus Portnoybacteria bacterium]|nr:MGMT family protein [Candidatus Portnoybacteria bacterium]